MVDAERSEKITINVGLVDLGQIDLLVSEGFSRIAPISFVQPFGASSKAGPTLSTERSPGASWFSA